MWRFNGWAVFLGCLILGGLVGGVQGLVLVPWQANLSAEHSALLADRQAPDEAPNDTGLLSYPVLDQTLAELMRFTEQFELTLVNLTPKPPVPGAGWIQQRYELQWMGTYAQMAELLSHWAAHAPRLKVLFWLAESDASGLWLTLHFKVWLAEVS